MIVGEKGAGKTILAIELVIGLARAIIADPTVNGGAVPVRLGAATWTTGRPFAEWLAEQLVKTYAISRREADSLVKGNLVMPVLDGLDEMDAGFDDLSGPPETGRPGAVRSSKDQDTAASRAAELIEALNTYYADATFAPVVVVTRPGCHTRLCERGTRLDHARYIEIRPLTTRQLARYLTDRHHGRPDQAKAWSAILGRLDGAAYKGVRTFLATPWRLMLATTAIESDPAQADQLVPGSGRAASGTAGAPGETARQTHERLEPCPACGPWVGADDFCHLRSPRRFASAGTRFMAAGSCRYRAGRRRRGCAASATSVRTSSRARPL
ncbi:NACHT domain-containing protein [Streptosporangium sp. G11]|uniref:NACHT domain-containing protein n=1 Tax=Streptosporangium sp. G11 TaxID=3436926 RepID=UPI003EBDBC66